MKIAVISDIHLSEKIIPGHHCRRGDLGAELLKCAVDQLNNEDHPDILLVAGDLSDSPKTPHLLDICREILETSAAPYIAIPGNHDPAPEVFYRHLPVPPDFYDLGEVRIIPFPFDPQTEGCNAARVPEEMERMKNLAVQSKAAVIFQHVPIFTFHPDLIACPYNYENAGEIIACAGENHIKLAISGHYHPAFVPYYYQELPSVAVPALCEAPFRYALCEIDGNGDLLSYTLKNTRIRIGE